MFEKGPYEKCMFVYIFFVRPLLVHRHVREGALRKIYVLRIYFLRKAPSRTPYREEPDGANSGIQRISREKVVESSRLRQFGGEHRIRA